MLSYPLKTLDGKSIRSGGSSRLLPRWLPPFILWFCCAQSLWLLSYFCKSFVNIFQPSGCYLVDGGLGLSDQLCCGAFIRQVHYEYVQQGAIGGCNAASLGLLVGGSCYIIFSGSLRARPMCNAP